MGIEEKLPSGILLSTVEGLAGYTIIKVNTRDEALDWAKRFPNPVGTGREAEIEVRQLFELEDFAPGEAVERFKEMGVGTR